MKVNIREAQTEDLRCIQELNLSLFKKEYNDCDSSLDLEWTFGEKATKYFSDRIMKDNGCVLVAVEKDKIVGYLCGGLTVGEPYRKLPKVAELENTFILSDYRSMGIGRRLYEKFLKWCKEKNVKKVKVEAFAQNEIAINFYRKNKFKDYTLILESDI